MNQQTPWRRLLEPHVPLKRRYRRTLALTFHGGYAALILFGAAHLSYPVLSAVYLVLIACFLLVFMSTGFVGDKPEEALDERQQGVRNLAYRYAYMLLLGVALVVWWMSDQLGGGTLAMYALLSYAALPSSVLAWLEPDPLPEEPSVQGSGRS